ncbi:MAG: DUF1501 domain-containing protein [Acidimicrobiia bacterium]
MPAAATGCHDLVVIHLAGGNDYLNTVVPYDDGRYHDARPGLGLHPGRELPPLRLPGRAEELPPGPSVVPLDERVGLHGAHGTFHRLYDAGRLAVFLGIGYPDRDRSHFRSLDIWHTADPVAPRDVGWLGRAAARLDPGHEEPVLLVNVGRALPLAMAAPGVLAASLESVDSYGIFPDARGDAGGHRRLSAAVRSFYGPDPLPGPWSTAQAVGAAALAGIDALGAVGRAEPAEPLCYPAFSPIAERLRVIADIKAAGVGSRVFFTAHDGYDTHENQLPVQRRLFAELSEALAAFLADLDRRVPGHRTAVLIFSEFGRRIAENRGGTDHGGAGVAFLVGDHVRGGLYGDYPDLAADRQIDGDLRPAVDFRALYTSVLEQFVGVEADAVLDRPRRGLDLLAAGAR